MKCNKLTPSPLMGRGNKGMQKGRCIKGEWEYGEGAPPAPPETAPGFYNTY